MHSIQIQKETNIWFQTFCSMDLFFLRIQMLWNSFIFSFSFQKGSNNMYSMYHSILHILVFFTLVYLQKGWALRKKNGAVYSTFALDDQHLGNQGCT
jgi:hypothetical protein